MPVRTALWKVGSPPEQLSQSFLANEQLLEDMIVAAPNLLSDDLMLIGRQEYTESGGRIDLLAIAPDASLVLIELKRDRTPRDVVAQAMDYASWVEKLGAEDIGAIYSRFASGDLAADFNKHFGRTLDESELNQSHQIIIVAASLDDSTERIVAYLSKRDIPINVLCFQVFNNGAEKLLSRTWLIDPVHAPSMTPSKDTKAPWNGEFYCSFGHGKTRSWAEAVEFGFICGGGGAFFSRTLKLLNPGDRVWVNAPGFGFVGVGRVTGYAQPASEFVVETPDGETPVLDVVKDGTYNRELEDDFERCEYFVAVEWLQTFPLEKAVKEIGLFGNQNTVCRPTTPKWRYTVEQLKKKFPNFESHK